MGSMRACRTRQRVSDCTPRRLASGGASRKRCGCQLTSSVTRATMASLPSRLPATARYCFNILSAVDRTTPHSEAGQVSKGALAFVCTQHGCKPKCHVAVPGRLVVSRALSWLARLRTVRMT